jgi:hypothetical protein
MMIARAPSIPHAAWPHRRKGASTEGSVAVVLL